jgi:hypothetical protein
MGFRRHRDQRLLQIVRVHRLFVGHVGRDPEEGRRRPVRSGPNRRRSGSPRRCRACRRRPGSGDASVLDAVVVDLHAQTGDVRPAAAIAVEGDRMFMVGGDDDQRVAVRRSCPSPSGRRRQRPRRRSARGAGCRRGWHGRHGQTRSTGNSPPRSPTASRWRLAVISASEGSPVRSCSYCMCEASNRPRIGALLRRVSAMKSVSSFQTYWPPAAVTSSIRLRPSVRRPACLRHRRTSVGRKC